ncbi:MlaD family protein [Maridesulfovibrio sp.]|uniref:MlaD family protein n=1 Tax=Maridesulfovibrio sp. TaxID=2795000 RepID=UPI0029CA1ACF|nr:MlaD family protein [Maridesulfovibrio sp.]
MSRKSNPFRLGLFIIIGMLLFVSVLAILGAGKIFERSVKMETYLNESVNGLEVGSPIKFRGVKIGTVSHIVLSQIIMLTSDTAHCAMFICSET